MKNKIITLLLLVCSSMNSWAQNEDITGKVVDRWGKPVAGALISVVANPQVKTATDRNGEFKIMVLNKEELEIRTSDFGIKTVTVTQVPMVITMDFASEGVDKGFGIQQTIAESTGAISRATNEQIDKRSSLSLANSLFGNALGLTALQNTGTVWETGASLSIRGLQTLSSNDVLILVDGFERSIQNLTPEEVESVSILRDASAVALYGYKGINGVVSIQTKRGKYETKDISISYDHAFTSQKRLPDFANGYTYANAMNEALVNDGKSARYSANELEAFRSGKYPNLYANVNWVDEVFRDHGASNIYNIAFRGGGTKVRYYTMLNLQDNSGFIKNTEVNDGYSTQMKFSKLNVRSNLDIDLTASTKLEIGILGILSEFSRPGLGSDNLMTKLYTVPSAAFPIQTSDGIWSGSETWGDRMNPVALVQARGYSKGHSRTLFGDVKLNQKLDFITKGLSGAVRFGYDNTAVYWEGRNRTYAYANDVAAKWTNGAPADINRYTAGTNTTTGFSSSLDSQDRHFNFVANVDYQKILGEGKLFSSLIYSYENHVKNGQHNTNYRQNVALYTHYAHKSRYIADLSLMTSASNKLAPGEKWGFSPTLSAAWVISNEPFMRDVKAIDFLKLRASAGIINTDYIPAENYWKQSFSVGYGYALGNGYGWYNGSYEGRLPSVGSTREKAYKYNLGLDAAFLKGFVLTTDAYYERRKDIFVSSSGKNSVVLGVVSPYVNAGIVDSWGFETGLTYDKKISDFTLSLGGKFTFAKNEIKEQLEEPRAYDYLRTTGKSIGQIFGLQAIGFFIDEADIANSPTQQFSEVKPGDIKYKDQNNDGVINEYDFVSMGYNTRVPEVYYSFDLGGEWKGLGISATFQGVSNYTAILTTQSMYKPLINNTTISNHYYNNRWTPDNPFAKYPRLTTEANDNNYQTNSIWLADASFLKMRNCEIYYKLPTSIIAKAKMTTAKVYVRGVDLLCIDHINVSDPESVGVALPATKSIHIGFAIGF